MTESRVLVRRAIDEVPGIHFNGLVRRLGIARSILEWHLDHLVEQDLVEKRRGDGNQVELRLVRPEATVELLAEIKPALPERLVDRFTRLVDSVLGE